MVSSSTEVHNPIKYGLLNQPKQTQVLGSLVTPFPTISIEGGTKNLKDKRIDVSLVHLNRQNEKIELAIVRTGIQKTNAKLEIDEQTVRFPNLKIIADRNLICSRSPSQYGYFVKDKAEAVDTQDSAPSDNNNKPDEIQLKNLIQDLDSLKVESEDSTLVADSTDQTTLSNEFALLFAIEKNLVFSRPFSLKY